MAQDFSNKKGQAKPREEFPETHRLGIGQSFVGLALEQKRDIDTQYGKKDCIVMALRGNEQKTFTFWWPHRLPLPPLNTPFFIARPSEKEYRLVVSETDEEMKDLWQTGVPPADAQAESASGMNGKVRDILKKFA